MSPGWQVITGPNEEIEDMSAIRCRQCSRAYPAEGTPFRCPDCGGLFDFEPYEPFNPDLVDRSRPGIWCYRATLGLPDNAPEVYLGEGGTPLVRDKVGGTQVAYKLESLNPTGSFKDRGSAVLASFLLSRGVRQAVEDSSGNAGASFSAYAAHAGIAARVFVPGSASGPKLNQIIQYGAELVKVPGPRSEAAAAVLRDAEKGKPYASHAFLPFGQTGIATIAYEIWEQLGGHPGTVIAPVGQGNLMISVMRGFASLSRAGLIPAQPHYIGVQAAACAPVEAYYRGGLAAMEQVTEGPTVAEGVRVRHPAQAEAIIHELGGGKIMAIPEEEILPAYKALACRGIFAEPTSALVWAALERLRGQVPEPVVLIISGSGLKYPAE